MWRIDAYLQTARGGIACLILLATTLFATVHDSVAISHAARRIDHAEFVAGQMRDVLIGLIDAETGQRGYLLTDGDVAYLQPYDAGVARANTAMARLGSSTAKGDMHWQVLQSLVGEKEREMAATICARDTLGFAAADAIVKEGTGKAAMDQIRQVIQDHDMTHGITGMQTRLTVLRLRMVTWFTLMLLGGLALALRLWLRAIDERRAARYLSADITEYVRQRRDD